MVPFLTGKKDSHRSSITSWIATARMARTQEWILEDVDPVYGSQRVEFLIVGRHIAERSMWI